MTKVLREQATGVDAGDSAGLAAGVAAALAGAGRTLGPGRVTAMKADRLTLSLSDGRLVEARSALAWPYEPALGDELLVVGEGDLHYVIGVLRGTGTTRLAFEGDVELSARGGSVDIRADRGVSIGAPDVHVEADRLTIVAEAAQKIVGTLRQTVRELFTLRAKEQHTLVEGNVLSHSKATRIVSEEKVTINGKEIFLG
ncbi:MAG: DUF3540 domain-containing protein [Polyangiaceae bacterium]|nr:DUF3540 domain-containing protein [Polyangiaceae bacterium]MBK8937400.1 DUF3540 domain-containing protein [Polyangiaceae bacterium]